MDGIEDNNFAIIVLLSNRLPCIKNYIESTRETKCDDIHFNVLLMGNDNWFVPRHFVLLFCFFFASKNSDLFCHVINILYTRRYIYNIYVYFPLYTLRKQRRQTLVHQQQQLLADRAMQVIHTY